MSFWNKFFRDPRKKEKENEEEIPELTSEWEKFVWNFTQNNGKFLMASSAEEVNDLLRQILAYEDADGYWIYDDKMKSYLDGLPYSRDTKPGEGQIFFGNARYLLENAGGILFTSYETGDFRLIDLPGTMVFLATPSQLVASKEKAMERINLAMRNAYPDHIHSIQHFSDKAGEGRFSKNVYLILKT